MDALTLMMMRRAMGGSQQPDPDTLMASNGAGPESLPPSPSPGMPPGAMASGTGPMMQPNQPPALSRMPPPASAVMQPPAREPGHIKKMFMDFMYGGTQALKKMQGMPTDDELRQQDLEFALKQREGAMREQLMTAQIQNYAADNQQKQQESEFRQQEQRAKDLREQNDPKNWTPEDRKTYGQQIGLKGNALLKFQATGDFTQETSDKSISELEGYVNLLGPEKGLSKYDAVMRGRAAAGRSQNITGGSAQTPGQPLSNPSWERMAQLVANGGPGGLTLDDAVKNYPIKSGAKEAITLRIAELTGGSVNSKLTPEAQKTLRSAKNASTLGNLILSDAQKHPEWLGGLGTALGGNTPGGALGRIGEITGTIDKDQATFRKRINKDFAQAAHELYGSAFTGTERQMAEAALPNINMGATEFQAAMEESLRWMQKAKDTIGEGRGGGTGEYTRPPAAAAPSGAKGWDDILGKKKR